MPTSRKKQIVRELDDMFKTSQVLIFTDYRGLKVSDITNLRRQLREKGVEYHVAKNTLTTLAADRAGRAELGPLLDGPTAIAFVGEDIPGAAKVLNDFVRSSRILQIRGGLIGTTILNPDQVADLTKILSRPEYIARLLGSMQSPARNLVNVLSGTIRGFMNVMQARIDQLKEQGDKSGAEEAGAAAEPTGDAGGTAQDGAVSASAAGGTVEAEAMALAGNGVEAAAQLTGTATASEASGAPEAEETPSATVTGGAPEAQVTSPASDTGGAIEAEGLAPVGNEAEAAAPPTTGEARETSEAAVAPSTSLTGEAPEADVSPLASDIGGAVEAEIAPPEGNEAGPVEAEAMSPTGDAAGATEPEVAPQAVDDSGAAEADATPPTSDEVEQE